MESEPRVRTAYYMSELSYVHRMNTVPPAMQGGGTSKMPPSTGHQQASLCCDHESSMRLAMENQARCLEYERNLAHARADSQKLESHSKELQAKVESLESRVREHERQARHTTEEARRWKQSHDDVRAAARELSYKTTLAEHKLREMDGKHRNLHENHAAMQAKYRALKDSVKAAQESAAKTESDWQKNAAKWKERCQDAVDKYEAVSKDAAEKLKEHIAAREKAEAVSKDIARQLKEHAASNEKLTKKISDLLKEHEQLKADHKVSVSDNARFHAEHTRLTVSNKALTHENEQFLSRMKLANADATELAKLKAEMPAVKSQMAKATKLQEEVAILTKTNQQLATEKEALKAQYKVDIQKHAAALDEAVQEAKKALMAERAKHKSEMSSAKSSRDAEAAAALEELRTAKKNISEKSQEMAQTLKMNETLKAESLKSKEGLRDYRHMLENAHKVLGVCVDYHAKSSGASDTPLFAALSDTCKTVDRFLASAQP